VGGLFSRAFLVRIKAEKFLVRIRELRVGADPESVARLRSEFRSDLLFDDSNCNSESCDAEFRFLNTPWHNLRMSPPIQLVGIARVKNHSITYVGISYSIAVTPDAMSAVDITEFEATGGRIFKLDAKPRKPGIIPYINVRFNDLASEEEKNSIFSLDTTCLSVPLKCKDAYDLAPLLARRSDLRFLLSQKLN
jgi:hypothetical protein